MSRYLLFMGKHYYPDGGWKDFKETSDSCDELAAKGETYLADEFGWFHIVDSHSMAIIMDKAR